MTVSWGGVTLKLCKCSFSPNFPFISISVDYGFAGELSVTTQYVTPAQCWKSLVSHTVLVVSDLGVAEWVVLVLGPHAVWLGAGCGWPGLRVAPGGRLDVLPVVVL